MKTLDRISQHSFLPSLLRPGKLVLDLGGNRGEFSRAIRTKYDVDVLAVEPTPELAEDLRRQGFVVREAAVTGEDGTTMFTYDPTQELTGSVLSTDIVSLLKSADKTIEVDTISLKSLIAGEVVDLVKVDIEGAELDMFERAEDDTLLAIRQFTVEFHDFWYPELRLRTEQVKKRLRDLGFWMMRGTPNNKDVLFVHPDHVPNGFQRAYINLWLRNVRGAGRALAILWRRCLKLH